MFSNCLVNCLRSKFKVIALYSTAVTPTTASNSTKYLISSLFMPKRKDEESNVKFETVKAADIAPTMQFIKNNFFQEDPLCRSLCITFAKGKFEDPIESMIRDSLREGMSIIARDEGENEIIGACINNRNCSWDSKRLEEYARNVQDASMRKLLYIWALMSREPNLHQELEISTIFEVSLLAINRKFSRRGLGTELVKRSLDLGSNLNFSYARMDCTSDFSMKIAEKLNMKRLWDVSFKNILTQDGKTPLAVPEYPHSQAAVYYTYLKEQSYKRNDAK